MDGLPIFNLVQETLPAVSIRGFRGVLNSTTNFILSALERGEPFGPALDRMQQAGVAEADPSLDLDGWDAAAKASALANVMLDADLTPHLVARDGIIVETAERARRALASGRRLKLVATGSGRGDRASATVRLEELDANDPLAILDGQANALEIDTWPLGRIVITQRDGGLEKTAYALVSDLVRDRTRHAERAACTCVARPALASRDHRAHPALRKSRTGLGHSSTTGSPGISCWRGPVPPSARLHRIRGWLVRAPHR